MVEVVDNHAGGTADSIANLKGLSNFGEEQAGMVPRIERLKHHRQTSRLANLSTVFQVLHHIGRLVIPFQTLVVLAGHHQRPAGTGPFGGFNGLFHLGGELVFHRLGGHHKCSLIELGFRYKRPQQHPILSGGLSDFLLKVGGFAHQAVIKEGPKALLVHKADLLNGVFAGMMFKLAQFRGIAKFEWFRFLLRLCSQSRARHSKSRRRQQRGF